MGSYLSKVAVGIILLIGMKSRGILKDDYEELEYQSFGYRGNQYAVNVV